MARTREAASSKKKPPKLQTSKAVLLQSAKDLGLKGYSRKTVEQLEQMIAEARPAEVQSPAPYDPAVEVLPTGFIVTPTVEVRVDGQLEIKRLDLTVQEPPNVVALLTWLTTDEELGYQQLVADYCAKKTVEIRQVLLDRYVQLNPNGGEPE